MVNSSKVGDGSEQVVMIHDWSCDHSSYDLFLKFCDQDYFTYSLIDLRGYGLSKEMDGPYDLDQAYHDVHAYLRSHFKKGKKVHLVGHSMSTLIVQKFLEKDTTLLKSATVVGPVSAFGTQQTSQDSVDFLTSVAKGNIEMAMIGLSMMTGNRLGRSWAFKKAQNWMKVSTEKARLDYMHMFVNADFSESLIKHGDQTLPLLVVTGKYDMQESTGLAMKETLLKWFPKAKHIEVENAGHYPMEETAPYFANIINQFHAGVA